MNPRRGRLSCVAVLAAVLTAVGSTVAAAADLVMFHSRTCPRCAAWDRTVGPKYDTAAEARLLTLRRVDADSDTDGGVRLAEPVIFTPTFLLVACGREVGRITGFRNEAHFWNLLGLEVERHRAALTADCRNTPSGSRRR